MSRFRPWIYGLAMLFVVLLIVIAGFVKPIRNILRTILVPIARQTSYVGSVLARSFHIDPDARASAERIAELEARLQTQTVDYVRLQALEEENASLLAQAKFLSDRGYRTLGARVISRSISLRHASITIDRGSVDGVEIGYAAVSENGLLVGKVVNIGNRTAVIRFVSDVESRIAATVVNSNVVSGVVEGRGNGVAHFTLVPQEVELAVNDVIVTAGSEEKIPRNIVIGLVNDVESKPTDPFKNAVIEPLALLHHIDIVSVIIPGPAEQL